VPGAPRRQAAEPPLRHRGPQLREACAYAGLSNPLTGAHEAPIILRLTEKTFTPEEANAALRVVRPLVERMVEAKRALDRAEGQRDASARRISGNGGGISPQELAGLHEEVERSASALARILDELHGLGLLVKDLDTGLVDFPALREGEPVLLCWRLGEDEVAYWHGREDGFAGRRRL
jgi:hypothetical protein